MISPINKSVHNEFRPIVQKHPKGFIHFLVAGHGGILPDGSYSIIKEGTKQALVDGRMVYEGALNRKVKDFILKYKPADTMTVDIVPTAIDMPLRDRVAHINKLYDIYTKDGYMPILWELHHNAFNAHVSGTEVFTTRKQNLSDTISGIWSYEAKKHIDLYDPNWKWRNDFKDDDYPDKEADFYVIKRAKCFGILMEFFFFDNPYDMDEWGHNEGQRHWAQTVINSMKSLDKLHKKLK